MTSSKAPLTAAVILARAGSKGIPQKNLQEVAGVSLVGRSVLAARDAIGVNAGVWVSTDGIDIAEEARRYGARVIERPASLSGDRASSEAGWLHALDQIRLTHPRLARMVLLQCTSAFTCGPDIDSCLAEQAAAGADCALSVVPHHGFLWAPTNDGLAHGVNHDETAPRPRRQDLPPCYLESGAIYTVDVTPFEATGRRFCGKVALCQLDHPPLEIDAPADLHVVRAIAAQRAGAGRYMDAAE